jgi:hypothetical protein
MLLHTPDPPHELINNQGLQALGVCPARSMWQQPFTSTGLQYKTCVLGGTMVCVVVFKLGLPV